MQMNLRDEARDFNKNLRQVQKNGLNDFETHKDTEKEENLPLRTSQLNEFYLADYNIYKGSLQVDFRVEQCSIR